MSAPEVLLAKYREAAVRADDTIVALRAAMRAQEHTISAQREAIKLLSMRIGRLESEAEELKAGL